MNSSGAVGDILVFTFVNLSDNTIYTENRKCISSSSKKTLTTNLRSEQPNCQISTGKPTSTCVEVKIQTNQLSYAILRINERPYFTTENY